MKNQTKTKDSFIIYRSFIDAIKSLPDIERLQIFDAISLYALDGKEAILSGISHTVFTLIKPQLDANRKRFENGCKDKKKSKPEAKHKQKKSKPEANDNVNDNLNPNKNLKSESEIIIPFFIDAEIWNGFLEMRIKAKAKPTNLAIKGILEKLTAFEDKKQGWANQSLKNSIENNWKGVFEPKPNYQQNSSHGSFFNDL
jgi:hypothetical protein